MSLIPPSQKRRWKHVITSFSFWSVVVLLVAVTFLHYRTAQTRYLPLFVEAFLVRHAVERILLILPVALATFAFRLGGGAITLGLVILIMVPRAILLSPHPVDAIIETTATAVVGCFVVWLIESLAREKELRRFYARQITRAQENERQRIARELHDETIQMLIVLSRRLEALAAMLEPMPETARQSVRALRELIGSTLSDTRRFVRDLRPPTLDHLGLVAAIRGLVNELRDSAQVAARLEVQGQARRLAPEEELALFRIAQEALNNVRRHSSASEGTVLLAFYPDRVRMTIEDNGQGFKVPQRMGDLVASGRLGLLGMHERAQALGGTLSIRSEPKQGTVVDVQVPVLPI